jgi:hypothetical protein
MGVAALYPFVDNYRTLVRYGELARLLLARDARVFDAV